jgi:hypothetical protein
VIGKISCRQQMQLRGFDFEEAAPILGGFSLDPSNVGSGYQGPSKKPWLDP